jgi:hypothetical protein
MQNDGYRSAVRSGAAEQLNSLRETRRVDGRADLGRILHHLHVRPRQKSVKRSRIGPGERRRSLQVGRCHSSQSVSPIGRQAVKLDHHPFGRAGPDHVYFARYGTPCNLGKRLRKPQLEVPRQPCDRRRPWLPFGCLFQSPRQVPSLCSRTVDESSCGIQRQISSVMRDRWKSRANAQLIRNCQCIVSTKTAIGSSIFVTTPRYAP